MIKPPFVCKKYSPWILVCNVIGQDKTLLTGLTQMDSYKDMSIKIIKADDIIPQ